jgi:hypothetical protein
MLPDAKGNQIDPAQLGIEHEAIEGAYDVTIFEDLGNGRTKLTFIGNESMENAKIAGNSRAGNSGRRGIDNISESSSNCCCAPAFQTFVSQKIVFIKDFEGIALTGDKAGFSSRSCYIHSSIWFRSSSVSDFLNRTRSAFAGRCFPLAHSRTAATVVMVCEFTVHFSTSFSTIRSALRQNGLYSLADRTTLGFAISLMTSARVALVDCFFVFLLPMHPWFHEPLARYRSIGVS